MVSQEPENDHESSSFVKFVEIAFVSRCSYLLDYLLLNNAIKSNDEVTTAS